MVYKYIIIKYNMLNVVIIYHTMDGNKTSLSRLRSWDHQPLAASPLCTFLTFSGSRKSTKVNSMPSGVKNSRQDLQPLKPASRWIQENGNHPLISWCQTKQILGRHPQWIHIVAFRLAVIIAAATSLKQLCALVCFPSPVCATIGAVWNDLWTLGQRGCGPLHEASWISEAPMQNHFQVANPWWAAKLRSGHQPSATGAVVIGVGSEWYPGDHHSIADTCYSWIRFIRWTSNGQNANSNFLWLLIMRVSHRLRHWDIPMRSKIAWKLKIRSSHEEAHSPDSKNACQVELTLPSERCWRPFCKSVIIHRGFRGAFAVLTRPHV